MTDEDTPVRVLLLQIVGPPLSPDEHEHLAESLDGALPEGYNTVLMHHEPRVEAMTKEDVTELIQELEHAIGEGPHT